jgi:hypothetical protein
MFTDAVREFLPWVEAEYRTAPASGRRIATSMTSCEVFFGRQMVSTIQPGDIERYKLWRLTPRQERSGGHVVEIPPVKPITLRHDLNNLSVFFQWAVKQDYARVNPLKDVDRPSDAGARRERGVDANRSYWMTIRPRIWIVPRNGGGWDGGGGGGGGSGESPPKAATSASMSTPTSVSSEAGPEPAPE